jgi:hypothetical protein
MKSRLRRSLFFAARLALARLGNGLALALTTSFVALFLSNAANAAPSTLIVGSNIEFSNGQAPASATKPWIEMTVSDSAPGKVVFKLTALNLTASENVSEFDFNLDPALSADLGDLTFANLTKTGSFDVPTIGQGVDSFKADGDGDYDINLSFTTGGNVAETFTNGDSVQYTISGDGISASSFDFLSHPDGGQGPFTTAAHIQNTTGAGSGGSGLVADSTGGTIQLQNVPEPSSCLLAGLGLIGMLVWRTRRMATNV